MKKLKGNCTEQTSWALSTEKEYLSILYIYIYKIAHGSFSLDFSSRLLNIGFTNSRIHNRVGVVILWQTVRLRA